MPFLNQQKGENDRRKYFMTSLHERMLPTSAGLHPRPPGLQLDDASNWATEAGMFGIMPFCVFLDCSAYKIKTQNMLPCISPYWILLLLSN